MHVFIDYVIVHSPILRANALCCICESIKFFNFRAMRYRFAPNYVRSIHKCHQNISSKGQHNTVIHTHTHYVCVWVSNPRCQQCMKYRCTIGCTRRFMGANSFMVRGWWQCHMLRTHSLLRQPFPKCGAFHISKLNHGHVSILEASIKKLVLENAGGVILVNYLEWRQWFLHYIVIN